MRFSIVKPWLQAFLYYGLLTGLSSIPRLHLPQAGELPLDKACHLLAYSGLGFLLARTGSPWWLAVLIASGLGGLDEFYQSFVPGRSSDWHDWLADTSGAALGAAVWVLVRRRRFFAAKA